MAAREVADGSARQALVNQRLEFQSWFLEQHASQDRAMMVERDRHQMEMQQLQALFASRVQALELQVQEAQGLYSHAAAELTVQGSPPRPKDGGAGRIVSAGCRLATCVRWWWPSGSSARPRCVDYP